jgi:alpha-glucosidase (family GH31 glycosyl hydrolase)
MEASKTGKPIICASDTTKNQHKLGEYIFVSAVTDDVLFKNVIFPNEGYWIDYWNEEVVFNYEKTHEQTENYSGQLPIIDM